MTSVSVVIPTLNRSKHLECAVLSVLAQTYNNLEVIVVDDGSEDDTAQVVQEYAHNDSRVRLIEHGRRKGAQAARNTGIRAAQGEWIAFLDSDDQWLPDSLQVRLRLARLRRLHVVHSDCYVLKPRGTEPQQFCHPAIEGNVYKKLLRRCGTLFPSLLVSKEAFTRIGYLDETIVSYQEWDTAIRLAKYFQFGFVRVPTFIYDCRFTDSMSKNLVQGAKGYEQVFTKHFWSIFRLLGPKGLVRHYQMAAHHYFEAGDEDNAWRCLMRARLLWPFRPRAILRRLQHLLQSGL